MLRYYLLLATTALGAFGLISYHVGARTKQIGTRRAAAVSPAVATRTI